MNAASLGLLRDRRFALYWAGRATSAWGSALGPVALAFAVVNLTQSPSALGLVLTAGFGSRVAFLLLGGLVADRLPRQRVMLAADSLRALTQALVAVLLFTGTPAVWQLAGLFGVYGTADAFFSPASVGIVAETVPPERVQEANALLNLPGSASSVVCPVLGGVLAAGAMPGLVFAIDAATFVVSAVTLGALRLPPAPCAARTGLLGDFRAGWRELRARTWVWAGIAYFSVSNLTIAPLYVLGPLVADRKLGGATAWGLIATCGGMGAVAGDVAALRLRPTRPLLPGFLLLSTWALEPVLLARPFPTAAIASAAALGCCAVAFSNAMWLATLQERIPAGSLSRVSSFDWLGSYASQPAGYALAGPIAAAIGIPATLVVGGVAHATASVAVAVAPPVRRLTRPPRAAARGN